MHADEVETNPALVRRLVAAQFPQWKNLPIEQVESVGTDNALYRIGGEMVARLPRKPSATGQLEKEHRWLPKLAPRLPLDVPIPLEKGEPNSEYPWGWSIYRWLEGKTATMSHIADPHEMARDLALFIAAMQQIDPTDGPPPGAHNFGRGAPLATKDAQTRNALADLEPLHMIDTKAALAAWEIDRDAPVWKDAPVWVHGDLQWVNLLAVGGRLSAVIDFGGLGVGDPAVDVMPAWSLFDAEARETFRAALNVDDATWARGRGWALSFGLIALPYYHVTNPILAGIARHAIKQVLSDHQHA
ncbi:MAG: aminoglycoside phosphotransferase family protein [Candidatus Poribacteria bacterium]|nr:aminoglycoside phosphotransferase family protein [Candidatus Poribacteria bacterium]